MTASEIIRTDTARDDLFPVTCLPQWLDILSHIQPPAAVLLVGAGDGTGLLMRWLLRLSVNSVTLAEADPSTARQLTAAVPNQKGWQIRQELVVRGEQHGHTASFHRYGLTAENGLLSRQTLQNLWPGLQKLDDQSCVGVSLESLVMEMGWAEPFGHWLIVDCFPAGDLLRGVNLGSTDVLLARVAKRGQLPQEAGAGIRALEAAAAEQGFRLVAEFEERNTAIVKALFVRDGLVAKAKLDAERKARHAEAAARAEAERQRDELSKAKAELQQKLDAESKGRQAEAAARAEAERQREDLSQFESDLAGLKKFKDEWSDANKNLYAHNRTLTTPLNSSLRDFAAKNLGLQVLKPAYIDYLALKAQQIEKNCVGRLATTIQDAVARQLISECVRGSSIKILEIGALYGVSLAILYNHAVTRFSEVKIICLDPFDGYYGMAVDALLNQPVNPLTFERNMSLANVPAADYSIIRRYSTDPMALEEINNHEFNLLIIDGDHSYDGVRFDFEKYFPLLADGGYVIFDDYNAKEWPGVQKFIDEDLEKFKNLQYLGSFSRTAVGRKIYR